MIKDSKLIFSPQLANYLLDKGCKIIELKAKRNHENETVFVFKAENELFRSIDEWTALKHK